MILSNTPNTQSHAYNQAFGRHSVQNYAPTSTSSNRHAGILEPFPILIHSYASNTAPTLNIAPNLNTPTLNTTPSPINQPPIGKGKEPNNMLLMLVLILIIQQLISQLGTGEGKGKGEREPMGASGDTRPAGQTNSQNTPNTATNNYSGFASPANTTSAISPMLANPSEGAFTSFGMSDNLKIELSPVQEQAIRTRFAIPAGQKFEFFSREEDQSKGIKGTGTIFPTRDAPTQSQSLIRPIRYEALDAQIINGTTTELALDSATTTSLRNFLHIPNTVDFRVIDVDKSGQLSVGDAILEKNNSTIKSATNNSFHNTIIDKADIEILSNTTPLLTLNSAQDSALRKRLNLTANQDYQVYNISGGSTLSQGDVVSSSNGRVRITRSDTEIINNLVRQQDSSTFPLSESQLDNIKERLFFPRDSTIVVIDSNRSGQLDKGDEILNISPRTTDSEIFGFGGAAAAVKIDDITAGIVTGRIKTITSPEQDSRLRSLLGAQIGPSISTNTAFSIYDLNGDNKISAGDQLQIKHTPLDTNNEDIFFGSEIRDIDELMARQIRGEAIPTLPITNPSTIAFINQRFGPEGGPTNNATFYDLDNNGELSLGDHIKSKTPYNTGFTIRTEALLQEITGTRQQINISAEKTQELLDKYYRLPREMTDNATLTAYDINRDGLLNDGDQIALNNPNSPMLVMPITLGTPSEGFPPLPNFPIGIPEELPVFAPQPQVDFMTIPPNEGRASLPPLMS